MDHRCEHDAAASVGLKGSALAQALDQAGSRCDSDGQRLTAPRRRVLELLLGAEGPVKAYDLIAAFGVDGEAAKPPTVYRALEFLERQGFAHRIESLNAYVACRLGADTHAAAFLICDCCGATREIEPAGADVLVASAGRDGFVVTNLTVEAHGLCAACRAS
ncbi:transcriptional repressor [Caulobacter sp. 17J65-9]|uniref:transcriptional repressor n=1 Tax=Caulobacter sp. 17J65-9 TaxID=2709382 RepID=UPI0013C854A9|nr:transcriptional repressor [Caulobacter sp. 17J65-9]NEX94775.1 transcriptional repressor [Caulobacter sp. 17J65-9]